jgi:hypothetical protein
MAKERSHKQVLRVSKQLKKPRQLKPQMAIAKIAARFTEVVTKGEQELVRGPPGFEYSEHNDTVYLRWLDHVREVCFGGEVSDADLRESTASRAVQSCCCEEWSSLSCPTPVGQLTCFDGVRTAPVSILKYGISLVKFLHLTPVSIIAARIYISRILEGDATSRFKPLVVSTSNIHRLYLTALMIGSKFFEDE